MYTCKLIYLECLKEKKNVTVSLRFEWKGAKT